MKPIVLGTGLSGLVGSRLGELLGDAYEFVNLDLANGVDITKKEDIEKVVATVEQPVAFLHLAAFTDVNQAEKEAGSLTGMVYRVNVEGTENIAQVCREKNIHLIHFSTSYVFNGRKNEPYLETDPVRPIDWYSQTKVWAEESVQSILPEATILRIAFPYRQDNFAKKDIWHKMADALKEGKTGPFFEDHFFTLTPIEWLANVVHWAIETKPAGVYHATTETIYTDLALAEEIKHQIGKTQKLIGSSVEEYNRKADRPYAPYLVLNTEKLQRAMAHWQPKRG